MKTLNDCVILDVIRNRIDEYILAKVSLKAKMIEGLKDAITGMTGEIEDGYNLYDKLNEILEYHEMFDFAANAIELLEQIIAIVHAPNGNISESDKNG